MKGEENFSGKLPISFPYDPAATPCYYNQYDYRYDGKEIVQLYFRDKVCKILTPVRTLIDFKKVFVPAGERVTVNFEIPTDALGYYNEKREYKVDAGEFIFYVSGDGVRFKEVNILV